MKRRDFVLLLGGVLTAVRPLRAQQKAMPVIGFLHSGSATAFAGFVAAFRAGLKEVGFAEGENVAIEFRWADGHYDRLPQLAADLANRRVDVIVGASAPTAAAAKKATAVIPIVFSTGLDPVASGFVHSLSRPDANLTGIYQLMGALVAKRFGILRDLLPGIDMLGVLLNPDNPTFDTQVEEIRKAAGSVGQRITILHAVTEPELDAAFAALRDLSAGGVLVGADAFYNTRREQIVALAARHGVPAIYQQKEFVVSGGLMSYGADLDAGRRQVGVYTGRVLKGEKPADLPVVQPTKFELVINLKTARTLGLTVPPLLLATADEVIE
jgi:putative ABC transport system substrate-binding protein